MKKLTLLVALILCVTIGGVYAAWVYTGNTMGTAGRSVSHGMATATTEGNVGLYKIEHNDIDIKVDQKATGDYTAVLVITGSVTVTFTPNLGAPADVVANALPTVAYLTLTDSATNMYEGKEIYKLNDVKVDLNWGTPNADGVFTATVTADQVASMIDINDFELDTHAKYEAFGQLEKKVVITFTVAKK